MKKLLLSAAFALFLGSLQAQSGAALNFDGTNDYVQISDPNFGTSDFTIETWMKPNTATGAYLITNRSVEMGGAGNWFVIHYTNNGAIGLELADAGMGSAYFATANNVITVGAWNHVALVRSGLNLYIYVNGVMQGSRLEPGMRNLNTGQNSLRLSGWANVGVAFFNGAMDETRLWNVARTECELNIYKDSEIPTTATGLVGNYHFNQGIDAGVNTSETSLTDFSASIRTGSLINFGLSGSTSNWIAPGGVVSGNTTLSVCPTASALNFDGVNDKIDISNSINAILDPLNTITVEAWVKPTNTVFNGVIVGNYASPNNEMQFLLRRDGDTYSFWVDAGSSYQVVSSGPSTVVLNTWQHVTGVWDGSALYLYIDGVLVSTVAGVTGSSFVSTGNNVVIGSNSYPEPFAGSIDEVRIWSTARSQCDIISYKNCEISGSISGLISNYHFNQGFPSDINPTVTTLTDASGNAFSGTLNNFALNGATSNWIAPGGVVSGSITPSACTMASALNLDGVNDYVAVSSTSLLSMTNAVTIEAWVKTSGTPTGEQYIISKSDDSFYMGLNVNGSVGKASFFINGVSSGWLHSTSTNINDDNWHHVASTYDGTIIKIYIDGILENSVVATGTISTGSSNINFGCRNNNNFLSGNIDEVRIWDIARTQCEIFTYKNCEIPTALTGLVANYHFNQGVALYSNPTETTLLDASGNGNNGLLGNMSLTGTTSNWVAPGAVVSGSITPTVCPVAAALDFDGSNDYVEIGNVIPSGNSYTKEMWVYALDNTCNNLLSSGDDPFYLSGGRLAAGNSGNYNYVQDVSNFPLNTWVHAAVTYDALTSTMKLYVNGNMVASGNSADPYSGIPTTYIGRHTGGCYFSGKLDDVRIWNIARTQCEINTYMNSEIPTSMTGLLANYNFNQGLSAYANPSETTLMDASGNGYNSALTGFGLNGSVSNWIAPGGVVSGYTTTLAPPVVTVSSGTICAGQSFTMVPSGAVTYTYSNGSDVAMPTADATYTVTGANAIGCESSATSSVTVNALPTVAVNSGAICAGQSFTMSPSGAATYTYSNGSDVAMPTADATYTVTGTDANGCENMATSSVTVNALPTISVNSGAICAGQSFTMSPSGAATYNYSNGSDVAMPTADASYTVTGTDANGCENMATSSVTVNALPTISVNSGAICAGQSFTMVPSGAATYTYSNGSDVAMPTADATYTVTGTDANGCENMAASSVTVNALPTVTVNNGTVCAGQSFTMVPSGAVTYTYSNGSDVAMPTADATYTVTGTDANGCENMTTSSVTVNALPAVAVNDGTVCAGQSFTMVPSGAVTYTYSNGSDVAMPTADATYTVTGTDANGCENMATSSVTVNALPALTATTSNTLMCTGQTATLSVSGASTYTWSTNETTSSIVIAPTSQATYTVDGTDANGCSNTTTITQDVSLCTGISNSSVAPGLLNIYPNPNNGAFTIKSDTDMQLNITNALGQVLQMIELNDSNNHETGVNVLANGVYFITGGNANQSVKQKVIVTQ